jgi:hypothetical protein
LQLAIRQWIHSRGWRNELQSKSLAMLLETAHDFSSRTLAQLHRTVVQRRIFGAFDPKTVTSSG